MIHSIKVCTQYRRWNEKKKQQRNQENKQQHNQKCIRKLYAKEEATRKSKKNTICIGEGKVCFCYCARDIINISTKRNPKNNNNNHYNKSQERREQKSPEKISKIFID